MLRNFKEIEKCDVWPRLQAGKKVFAVILESSLYREGVEDLTANWSIHDINALINKEANVAFYGKIEREDK